MTGKRRKQHSCEGHKHPHLKKPVPRAQVRRELEGLYRKAGLSGPVELDWPEKLGDTHDRNTRRYAQVAPFQHPPAFELAPQTAYLPDPNRRALLAHEVGHVLVPHGSEDQADAAAFRGTGVKIGYDPRWRGKGLQVARNPDEQARGFERSLRPDSPAARLDYVGHLLRIGQLDSLRDHPDPFLRFVGRNLEGDLAMDRSGGYTPSRGPVLNRIAHEHEERISGIGRELFGDQFWWERDGSEAAAWFVGYRDNRDRPLWREQMGRLGLALEGAGYTLQIGEPPVSSRVVVELGDQPEAIFREYIPLLREFGGGREKLAGEWYRSARLDQNPPPDERFRRLEREAAGDAEAATQLAYELERAGRLVPLHLQAVRFSVERGGENVVTRLDTGGKKRVKNQGWLLRAIQRFGGMVPLVIVVRTLPGGRCYFRVELSATGPFRSTRTHTFETVFQSCQVLWDFLQRPTFDGYPLDWDGRRGEVVTNMHPSTFGHPFGAEGGPDAECYRCHQRYWSGDEGADPDRPRCPTCYAGLGAGRARRGLNPRDEDIRDLERHKGESPEALAEFYRAGIRTGEINPEKLVILARMGSFRGPSLAISMTFGKRVETAGNWGFKDPCSEVKQPWTLWRDLLTADVHRGLTRNNPVTLDRIVTRYEAWAVLVESALAIAARQEAPAVPAWLEPSVHEALDPQFLRAAAKRAIREWPDLPHYKSRILAEYVGLTTAAGRALETLSEHLFESGSFSLAAEIPDRWTQEAIDEAGGAADGGQGYLEELVEERSGRGQFPLFPFPVHQVDVDMERGLTSEGDMVVIGYPGIAVTQAIFCQQLQRGLLAWLNDQPPPDYPGPARFPSSAWRAGSRVQMRADHWTGLGARAGTVESEGSERVLVRFDDGALVDVNSRALEEIRSPESNPPKKGGWKTPPPCDPSSTKKPLKVASLKGKVARVHVNLHNGCYTVSSKGKVQGYTKSLVLKGVLPKVSLSGWERCRKTGVRNVHAYIQGTVVSGAPKKAGRGWRKISYRCKTAGPHFFYSDTGDVFEGAAEVRFLHGKGEGFKQIQVWAKGPPPAKKNPSCGCDHPGGGCSCGSVQDWWVGNPPAGDC